MKDEEVIPFCLLIYCSKLLTASLLNLVTDCITVRDVILDIADGEKTERHALEKERTSVDVDREFVSQA
jgi:hypothetical protein